MDKLKEGVLDRMYHGRRYRVVVKEGQASITVTGGFKSLSGIASFIAGRVMPGKAFFGHMPEPAKPGRPRKVATAAEHVEQPKRKRGRPRKIVEPVAEPKKELAAAAK